MKKIYFLLITSAIFACNNNPKQETTPEPHIHNDSLMSAQEEDHFKNVKLASDKDTICGMSIAGRIKDTLMLDGKVYGFCATGCKMQFAAELVALRKR